MDFPELYAALTPLCEIPKAEWKHLSGFLRYETINKGELFLRWGDDPVKAGFVVSGLMRAYYLSADMEEYIRSFGTPGDFISDYSAAIQGLSSGLYVDSLAESTLITFPYPVFGSMLPRHICWQVIGRKIAERYYLQREKHARDLLILDAAGRFQEFLKQFPGLHQMVSQRMIAQYLGISEVSLSRVRRNARESQRK